MSKLTLNLTEVSEAKITEVLNGDTTKLYYFTVFVDPYGNGDLNYIKQVQNLESYITNEISGSIMDVPLNIRYLERVKHELKLEDDELEVYSDGTAFEFNTSLDQDQFNKLKEIVKATLPDVKKDFSTFKYIIGMPETKYYTLDK